MATSAITPVIAASLIRTSRASPVSPATATPSRSRTPTSAPSVLNSPVRAHLTATTSADDHAQHPGHRPTSAASMMIGRIPLRELLAYGLDDALRFRAVYTGHRHEPDGRVTAEFADGSTDTGDVLVGADGARSAVARVLAGRTLSAPTGVIGVAGRTPLDDPARDLVPDVLNAGPALAIGPRGVGAFLTLHDPATAAVDPAACTAVPARLEQPYLLWAPALPATSFPRPPQGLDGPGLVELSLELFREWSAPFRELVRRADPDTVGCFPFLAADPEVDPAPWPTGAATALGDAVHAMPPTGGRGAATAMRDADALVTHLAAAAKGTVTVPLALHAYQREMATWGPSEVRESLRPLVWQERMSRPWTYRAGRLGLAAVGTRSRRRDRVLERSRP